MVNKPIFFTKVAAQLKFLFTVLFLKDNFVYLLSAKGCAGVKQRLCVNLGTLL